MAKPAYPGLVLVPPSDRQILRRRLARLAFLIIAATSYALAFTDWLPLSGNKPDCQTASDDREFPDSREECAQPDLSVTEAQPGESESIGVELTAYHDDPANGSSGRTMVPPDRNGSAKRQTAATAASYPHPDTRLAQQGDAFAQYRLGRFLAQRGEPHARESVHWYRKASDGLRRLAETGNGQAMYVLGVMNAFGRGIERDTEEARRWLTQAVEHKVEDARPVLARLEQRRDAKPRDAQPKGAEPRDTKPTDAKPRDAEPSLQAQAQVERVRHDN